MDAPLSCYRCGQSLEALTLPLSREDQCPGCSVYVHCCRMCVFYDPEVAEQCREDDAEEVKNKEGANFCDFFAPNPNAHDSAYVSADSRARTQLDTLFDSPDDGGNDGGDDDTSAAEDLFR